MLHLRVPFLIRHSTFINRGPIENKWQKNVFWNPPQVLWQTDWPLEVEYMACTIVVNAFSINCSWTRIYPGTTVPLDYQCQHMDAIPWTINAKPMGSLKCIFFLTASNSLSRFMSGSRSKLESGSLLTDCLSLSAFCGSDDPLFSSSVSVISFIF